MNMILVATDFSEAALNAANYSADMALAMNAHLRLLHVYQVPVSYGEMPIPVDEIDLKENAEDRLENLKKDLLEKTRGKISIDIDVRVGVFFPELKTACEEGKPSAVVMGSQGTTAAERFFFGSHTLHAMKHLKWPVITVPPEARFSAVKKIGLACDFDKVLQTIPFDEIKLQVKEFKAAFLILNTGKKDDFDPTVVFESEVLREKFSDLKPEFHFITSNDVDEGIIAFTEKNQVDLLLVLPRRHDLPEQLRHKSHTKQFVLHSHVPVMSIHQ